MQSVLNREFFPAAVGDNAKTPFGQMGGTSRSERVAAHERPKLVNDVVEMNGSGDGRLSAHALGPSRPVAKKASPLKLVDVGIRSYVKGPWNKPSYGPDARLSPRLSSTNPSTCSGIPASMKSLFVR